VTINDFTNRKAVQLKTTTTAGFSNVTGVSYSPIFQSSYKTNIESILCQTEDCIIYWDEPISFYQNWEYIIGGGQTDGIKSLILYESDSPADVGIIKKEIFDLEKRSISFNIGENQKIYFSIGVKNIWDQIYIEPNNNIAETNQTLILSGYTSNGNGIILTNINGSSFMYPAPGIPTFIFHTKTISKILGIQGSQAAFYEPNNSVIIMGRSGISTFIELSLDGSKINYLRDGSNDPEGIQTPFAISPNQEWIYFHAYDWYDGGLQIFRRKISGGPSEVVTDGKKGSFEIVDNNIILRLSQCEVFGEYRTITYELFSIDEANNVTMLYTRKENQDGIFSSAHCPNFDGFISNDLSKYVFSSSMDSNGKPDIYLVDLTSNEDPINLTNHESSSSSPRIINNYIYFLSKREHPNVEMYKMKLDGTELERLGSFYSGAWTFLDNRSVIAISGNENIKFYDENLNLINSITLKYPDIGKMRKIFDIIN
jgi:hypothetical protein